MEYDKSVIKNNEQLREFISVLREDGLTYREIGKYLKACRQHVQIFYTGRLSGRDFIREKIRIRDNHTCQMCGKKWEEGKRRFDVHHVDCRKEKTQQYDNYELEKDNLITLCHKCHLNLPEHKKAMSDSSKKETVN